MGAVRVYLALCVVLIHCKLTLPFTAGHFAVEMFFIISGFCMALVLNEKYTDTNPVRFYIARYLRLWPTYIVVLIVAVTFLRPFPPFPGNAWTNAYFYFSTFSLIGHDTLWLALPTSDGLTLSKTVRNGHTLAGISGMQQMWSVGVELTFYILAPLFARNWRMILVLCVAAFVVHVWLVTTQDRYSPILLRTPLDFFWLFLLGMLAYWAWRATHPLLSSVRLSSIAVAITAVIITGGLIYMRRVLNDDVLLFAFGVLLIPLFHLTKNALWDRAIGELSYPIYVAHWPLILYFTPSGRVDVSLVVVALTVVAAIGLHLLVVMPIDAWRARLATCKPSDSSVTSASWQHPAQ